MVAKLNLYTLGRFRVENGEETVTKGVNKTSKRWQLLQYLITYRQRDISREELITSLNLHENSDPEGALSALVYRLRKRLENGYEQLDDFIKTNGSSYTFNLRKNYWLDAEEFDQLCQQCQEMAASETEGVVEKFQQALTLYQGDYLEEARSHEWVWNARNYYRDLLVTTLGDLDEYMRRREQFEQLWEFYEKVHEMVKFDEKLLTGAIRAMLEAGREGLARMKYEEAVSIFKENDLELPPDLEKLGRQLSSGSIEDPNNFIQKIRQRSLADNAFVCEPQTFSEFYELEKRRAERDVPPRHVVHLRLAGNMKDDSIDRLAEDFLNHLITQLRKGDIICRWDNKHFILLLHGVEEQEAEKVVDRLKTSFAVCSELPESLKIENRCYEVST